MWTHSRYPYITFWYMNIYCAYTRMNWTRINENPFIRWSIDVLWSRWLISITLNFIGVIWFWEKNGILFWECDIEIRILKVISFQVYLRRSYENSYIWRMFTLITLHKKSIHSTSEVLHMMFSRIVIISMTPWHNYFYYTTMKSWHYFISIILSEQFVMWTMRCRWCINKLRLTRCILQVPN